MSKTTGYSKNSPMGSGHNDAHVHGGHGGGYGGKSGMADSGETSVLRPTSESASGMVRHSDEGYGIASSQSHGRLTNEDTAPYGAPIPAVSREGGGTVYGNSGESEKNFSTRLAAETSANSGGDLPSANVKVPSSFVAADPFTNPDQFKENPKGGQPIYAGKKGQVKQKP